MLLRGDLDWIVMKCLEKDRARRYETANGLAADLKRHLTNEPVVARPPSTAYRFQKAFRRNKLMFTAATAVAAALVVGVAVSTWQAVRARRAENVQSRLYGEAEQARANEAVQRHKAEIAREQTETSAQIARQNLYAADMSLVQQALQANNLGRARRLLDRNRPETGEQDLRGWEWRYLWQQCRSRAITTLARHTTRATTVNFSADSELLAVGYGDGRLEVWDVASRKLTSVLKTNGPAGPVRFAPRGRLLAQPGGGAKDGEVLLWSATATPSADTRFVFPSHVHSAAVLPREPAVLTLSTNGVCSVWGVPSLTETALPFAPNSIQFFWPPNYLGGYDQTNFVRLYAVQHSSTRLVGEFPVGPRATRIIYLPEERTLFWQDNSGKPQRLLVGEDSATTMQTGRGKTSPDGKLEAFPSESGVATLRERATKRTVMELRGQLLAVDGVAFTPDGKRLATTSGGREAVKLWDTATGQELLNLPGHGMNLYNAEFSEDGNVLLVGWLGAGFWQLWQAPPWTEIEKIERNGGGWPRLKEP